MDAAEIVANSQRADEGAVKLRSPAGVASDSTPVDGAIAEVENRWKRLRHSDRRVLIADAGR